MNLKRHQVKNKKSKNKRWFWKKIIINGKTKEKIIFEVVVDAETEQEAELWVNFVFEAKANIKKIKKTKSTIVSSLLNKMTFIKKYIAVLVSVMAIAAICWTASTSLSLLIALANIKKYDASKTMLCISFVATFFIFSIQILMACYRYSDLPKKMRGFVYKLLPFIVFVVALFIIIHKAKLCLLLINP